MQVHTAHCPQRHSLERYSKSAWPISKPFARAVEGPRHDTPHWLRIRGRTNFRRCFKFSSDCRLPRRNISTADSNLCGLPCPRHRGRFAPPRVSMWRRGRFEPQSLSRSGQGPATALLRTLAHRTHSCLLSSFER